MLELSLLVLAGLKGRSKRYSDALDKGSVSLAVTLTLQ